MADTIKTIGTAGDYADPILWAAGQGGISDGNREVGELISDVTMNALFRPNQAFPDGGLLRGDTTVTGEIGVGRVLANQAATRFCLAPSPNIEFCDLRISDGGVTKTTTFQNIDGNTFTRIISMDSVTGGTINPLDNSTGTTVNNSALYMVTYNASTVSGDLTLNNCYVQERILCRNNNLLTIKNSISQAADWYLGRPGDSGAESLVNYCKIFQNAPADEFGPGSSNNTVNVDSSAEFVDLVGGDFRIKSTSPYAIAGDTGGVLGPFLEVSAGEILAIDSGSYSLIGTNVNLTAQYKSTLESGSYSLSGSAIGLIHDSKIIADSGTYSLTGTQANLIAARKIIADSGSYNLTGTDVALIYTPSGGGEVLSIDSGTFSLSGSDIGLKAARLISLNSGSYSLTGQSVALAYNAKTIIDSGSYALTGSNVNLFANRVIIAQNGSYNLTGSAVTLRYSGDTAQTIGTVSASFANDKYSVSYKPTSITVNFKE